MNLALQSTLNKWKRDLLSFQLVRPWYGSATAFVRLEPKHRRTKGEQ
jgi:hypothetical protein